MRQEGGAVVRITIGPEGEVRTSSLVRSSGYTLLDKAAIEAVRRAQPFPPPAEYGLEPLSIDVPIHYRIL
jgi:protein TonB